MTAAAVQEREHSPIDITSHDFWSWPFAVRDETFARKPAQRDWLMEDFENRIGPAVEEFVRWSSPVLQFARFVTEDTEINGYPVGAGDRVGLFYCSANRDESVFDEPGQFKLQHSPNPHLRFGGSGPHFCLGNQLAKTELRNLFRELLTRLKTVEFGQAPSGVRPVGDIMRVEVDLDKCTGHGICESIADDVFEVQDDGTVLIHENERPETDRDRMQQAVTQCPAAALRLVD